MSWLAAAAGLLTPNHQNPRERRSQRHRHCFTAPHRWKVWPTWGRGQLGKRGQQRIGSCVCMSPAQRQMRCKLLRASSAAGDQICADSQPHKARQPSPSPSTDGDGHGSEMRAVSKHTGRPKKKTSTSLIPLASVMTAFAWRKVVAVWHFTAWLHSASISAFRV
jgi:hypothetical protein